MRFIDEYAGFKKKHIQKDVLIDEETKLELIGRIDHIVKMSRRGYITLDETMREIAEVR